MTKIEFSTEMDLHEHIEAHKNEFVDSYWEDGKLFGEFNFPGKDIDLPRSKTNAIVCALCDGKYLYLANKGTTFFLQNAKKFTEKTAKDKCFFMNKNSKQYIWQTKRTS